MTVEYSLDNYTEIQQNAKTSRKYLLLQIDYTNINRPSTSVTTANLPTNVSGMARNWPTSMIYHSSE